MTARFAVSLAAMLTVVLASAREPASDDGMSIRATVELTDGSRLIGCPADKPLSLTLDYAQLNIPLSQIRQWDANTPTNKPESDETGPASLHKVTVNFTNGDRLTGTLNQSQLQLDTILGPLAPELKYIRSVSYTAWREGNMPPGEGNLFFGGLNWLTWHTEFAIEGDRLKSLPKARPGFDYGHSGHGRGPMLMANIGDPNWRDYSLDVQLCAAGVDPSFNPYGLGSDFYDASIMFHIADAKESFNERGSSFYILGLHGSTGTWELRAVYNSYCDQPVGWGNPKTEAERTLAQGVGLRIDRQNGNRIRIDVVGNHIQAWFEDSKLLDVVDNQMTEEIGGQRLDHGGVGFGGGFDAMIWIENVSVRSLAPSEAPKSVEQQSDEPSLQLSRSLDSRVDD